MIMDFNNFVDYNSFVLQLEVFLKNKDLLKQVAFDIYDYNNDSKISEMDLFKMFQFFSKGQHQEIFESTFQQDFCEIIKYLSQKEVAFEASGRFNGKNRNGSRATEAGDNLRHKYFRNVNVDEGTTFENKKKKLFQSMYKIKKLSESGGNWNQQINMLHKMENSVSSDEDEDEKDKEENDFFGHTNYYFTHVNKRRAEDRSRGGNRQADFTRQVDKHR